MNNKILKTSIIFTAVTILGKSISLIKDILISNIFGVSVVTDAYNLSLTIPNILYASFASAIMITLIPNFYEVEEKDGLNEAFNFVRKFITITMGIMIVLFSICMIFTENLIEFMVPGMDNNGKVLAVELTRITLINLIFMVISSTYSSILRSKNKFIGVSLMPLIINIPLVIFLFIMGTKINIKLVTLLTSIGYAIQFIVLLPEMKSIGFNFIIRIKGYRSRILDMIKKIVPMMLNLSVVQISQVIDRIIGSDLQVGSITSLDLSNKVITLVYGVLSSTIVTIFSPIMAKKFLKEDKEEWLNVISDVIKYLLLILVPISIGVLVLNNNIIQLLYMRGNFTSDNVDTVSIALFGYILQIPFISVRDVVGQGFYSMKNTIVPALNGSIAVVINIIFTVILAKHWGVFGITFATSISVFISAILLLASLKKQFKYFNLKYLNMFFYKITFNSIVMGIMVYLIKEYLQMYVNNLMVIIICTILGIIIYTILGKFNGIYEIDCIVQKLRQKLFKHNRVLD